MVDRRILVVVDPTSEAQPAVERAAWLAERLSAGLELFICDYPPEIISGLIATELIDTPAREIQLALLNNKLEAIATPLRKRGLEVAVDIVWDHPLDQGIVRKIDACQPWLVAKDTHHHNVLKRTILRNTDWHLIRECPSPLLLVKPEPIAEKPKIFAAVDPLHSHDKPAKLDDDIVNAAKTLAEGTGGELHVLHTYMMPVKLIVPDTSSITQITEEFEWEHRQAFTSFLARHAVPDDRAHFERGSPHERLPVVAARENVGIIVMGAVSRRGVNRAFIGSTAERVLEHLPCDVLIIQGAKSH